VSGSDLDARDDAARWILARYWAEESPVERVEIGVNRWTWQVGAERFLVSASVDRHAHTEREIALRGLLTPDRFPWSIPRTVLTSEGRPLVRADEREWWVTTRVFGRHPDPASAADTGAVARALGHMHNALRALDPAGLRLADQPSAGWAPHAREFVDEHRSRLTSTDTHIVCAAADEFERRWSSLAEPTQTVHGDPSLPNLMIHDTDRPVVTGILDWEEAAWDTPLIDLAATGLSVVFWSGRPDLRSQLRHVLDEYQAAREAGWTEVDILTAMVGCKLESVVHHGRRYLAGHGPRELMSSQPKLMKRLLDELGAAG
jgi:Ser/Thr protein kinase RdoA (MazF antagonist)